MEWIVVRFPRVRDVFIDARLVGMTNQLISTYAGPQTIALDPAGPPRKRVTVKDTLPEDPMIVLFMPA